MITKNIRVLITGLIFILAFSCNLSAQVVEQVEDLDAPVDTAEFYKKLYDYSKKKKFLYVVYRAIFNPPGRPKTKKKAKPVVAGMTPTRYKGKIIRNVSIISFEPFGTSLNDTSRRPHSFLQKGGNTVHALTNNARMKINPVISTRIFLVIM